MRKLVIFDRDNTLIEDKGHTYKIKDLKFLPDTIKALQYISKKKYKNISRYKPRWSCKRNLQN